ncbi:MAG: hypothetical protein HYZ00_11615, partial [Candidatus Hydrogenedentes bacterium]|nr:hypothetical protein [Candidatus Hydrogenedentota bacterium]
MSGYDSIGKRTIVLRALVAVGIVGVALLLGLLLARLTTSTPTMETIRQEQSAIGSPVKPTKETQYVRPEAPPLFFFAGVNAEGDWSLSLAEIGMAAKSGLHQFILPVRLPWRDADTIAALEVLGRVVEADPLAAFLVQVDLNPPAAWLEGHPGDQVVQNGQRLPFAAPASVAWVEEARAGWTRLLRALGDSPFAKRLIGFMPAALHEGQWHFEQPGFDTSTANAEGFREWLRGIYVEASALQQAWANPEVQFETAALPERANGGDLTHVFFDLPQQQPIVDYLNYISEVTADALAAFTTHIKNTSEAPMKVIVPYGYTFDLLNNDAGHFSLSILAGSDVDGFISPVSAVDRGSGGAGGFMGPVNTAHLHAKQWYIIDNTRTGVARDALTGAVSRLKGIRPGDVYSVQQRNFAAAAVYGLGLVWSDPAGEGWMHEEDQWVQLGRMHEIYVKLLTQAAEKKQAEEEEAEQREVAAPQ